MSHQSANDMGDNDVKPGAGHRSSEIYLTAEENPRKPQLGVSLMKAVLPVIASNGGSLPPNDISRIAQHIREGEGKKEGKDWVG